MKRHSALTPQRIIQWIADGRGQGRGLSYQPWFNVQEMSSHGVSHRVKGQCVPRIYHFVSTLERDYFYGLELHHATSNATEILDIREQVALLPHDKTLALAEAHNIKHPQIPKTKQPIVMTTDFVITYKVGYDEVDVARSIKPSKDLTSKRTLEKLELERQYWRERDVDWGIVTEREMNSDFIHNARLLRPYHELDILLGGHDLDLIRQSLQYAIWESSRPLNATCLTMDRQLGLEPGTSLSIVYHALANDLWHVDLQHAIRPTQPLRLLSIKEQV